MIGWGGMLLTCYDKNRKREKNWLLHRKLFDKQNSPDILVLHFYISSKTKPLGPSLTLISPTTRAFTTWLVCPTGQNNRNRGDRGYMGGVRRFNSDISHRVRCGTAAPCTLLLRIEGRHLWLAVSGMWSTDRTFGGVCFEVSTDLEDLEQPADQCDFAEPPQCSPFLYTFPSNVSNPQLDDVVWFLKTGVIKENHFSEHMFLNKGAKTRFPWL